MKKNFTAIVALLAAFCADAQTYTTPNTGVDWTINDLVSNSDGTVVGAFPNYNVLDSIIIAPNDRLSIPAGSRVAFVQNGFVIRGKFLAIGTAANPIFFTGATQSPASWRNIRFEDSAVDSACLFRHCIIEYSTGGIACINASPTIEFSTLRFNGSLTTSGGSFAVQCFNSNAIILNDSIYNNSQIAINISNTSSPIIENNYIANNNVRNSSPANPITVSFQGANNPVIRCNEIHSADIPIPVRAGGIGFGLGSNTTVQNPIIEENYIHDCAFGIVVAGATQCLLKNNRIVNNNRNPNPLVAGSGVNINSSGSAIAAPILVGNFIKGNLWGVTIQGTATPNLGDLVNTTPDDDGRNTFIDNGRNDSLFALYNNTTNAIKAQNNFWGTSVLSLIEQRIWGAGDVQNPTSVMFLPFALNDISLPVELAAFRAKKTDKGIALNWKTASEQGNAGFEIQRSGQCETETMWQSLAFIEGGGTTTETKSYSFLDETASGQVRYRLKQIDFDGRVEFSNIIEIDAGAPNEFALGQNYPNPFNPSTTIRYQLPALSDVRLDVVDLLGRKVVALVSEKQSAGIYTVKLNASAFNLSSGIYFYRLSAGNFIATKKMMLLK
jgi:parallel beta-helix repeat protein